MIIDMGRRLTISILALFISVVATAAFGAGTAGKSLLRDGFVLASVDGKLTRQDSNTAPELWFFRFATDVNDGRGRVAAGTSLELLPSSTLEKMTADMGKHLNKNYRLSGRVTKYKGRNFIFPIYFLPLSETSRPEPSTLQKPAQQKEKTQLTGAPNKHPRSIVPANDVQEDSNSAESGKTEQKPTIYDPKDALSIPQGIIENLKGRRKATVKRTDIDTVKTATAKPPKRTTIRRDFVLANRIGFLIKQHKGLPVFGFDALGRNIQQPCWRLLPCEALERTEQQQSAEVEQRRFKIAGIVTKYKGKDYLLLERAIQVYSHENFDR